MASPGPKKPMFAMANAEDNEDNFEEDEDDSNSVPQTSAHPDSTPKPFTLFSGSFFSSTPGDSKRVEATKADVVEGEEDEDEPDASTSTLSAASGSLPTHSANSPATATSTGTSLTESGSKITQSAEAKARAPKQYTKSERQVVDMNLALRKAPVKKLKETFVNIRSELAPTQASLTASVRAASEASALSSTIDEQLSALSDKFQAIRPVFSV